VDLGFGVGILDMNEVSCLCREYDCDFSDQAITLLSVSEVARSNLGGETHNTE
jgi:hypothetical protein